MIVAGCLIIALIALMVVLTFSNPFGHGDGAA